MTHVTTITLGGAAPIRMVDAVLESATSGWRTYRWSDGGVDHLLSVPEHAIVAIETMSIPGTDSPTAMYTALGTYIEEGDAL